ncbi:hypothetical protein ACWKSJ_13920 (plasmid) [Staphylococcus equorum]
MEKKPEHKKNSSMADAIIGGVFGVTVGWFYKREETQLMLKRVKESEIARNIASDVYKSTEENLKEFATMSIERQRNNLFQNNDTSSSEDKDVSDDKKESPNKNQEKSYATLKEENERLEEMISYLEQKFENIS